MKGTLNVVFIPFEIEVAEVHVAVIPLVEQVHPLLLVGNVPNNVPVGIWITTVINPFEGAVPIFVTVTGI